MEHARAATLDDVPRVVELARELRAELRVMRGGALWETREARVAPFLDALTEFVTRDDATLVIGSIDELVVGYGTAELEALADGTQLGIIGDLYVEPDARGIGVGEAIAEQLVAFCVDARCVGIDAFALPGHREAKNFFERAGFTARALVMHKPL
jgi:GNAT superfamily N-acetyltransferase